MLHCADRNVRPYVLYVSEPSFSTLLENDAKEPQVQRQVSSRAAGSSPQQKSLLWSQTVEKRGRRGGN